jgi:hypothetical protein
LLTGVLSDFLTPTYGAVGLRYALMIATTFLVLSALLFAAAASSIEADLED